MEKIGVIGAGPIGLAVAETISNLGRDVCVFDVKDKARATYRAAAAFWTPFSSGVDDASAARQSKRTLLHFTKQARNAQNIPNVTGIEERRLEMHFLRDTFGLRPLWSSFESLGTSYASLNAPHLEHQLGTDLINLGFPAECETRCEMTYNTPVVCVDKYIPWAKTNLEDKGCSIIQADLALQFSDKNSVDYWRELIKEKDVGLLVFCLGVEMMNTGFLKAPFQHLNSFTPKKGVVAHIPSSPASDDCVILFEGGVFDTETVYLVPAVDRFILGGTVHSINRHVRADAWVVTPEEKRGILTRAMTFLPSKYHQMIEVALGTPNQLKQASEWRAGVRPVFDGGPLIGEFADPVFDCRALYCFGHGGSGFTFCYDSADTLIEKL